MYKLVNACSRVIKLRYRTAGDHKDFNQKKSSNLKHRFINGVPGVGDMPVSVCVSLFTSINIEELLSILSLRLCSFSLGSFFGGRVYCIVYA